MDEPVVARSLHRPGLAAFFIVALLLVAGFVTASDGPLSVGNPCGGDAFQLRDRLVGAPLLCAHRDAPPPGVHVHTRVPTAALRARKGAGRDGLRGRSGRRSRRAGLGGG
ncbi:MAG TPA: hypothetical protein VE442_02615 [Jatrophihabitans sp.]|jgi:hypothetical protein|nr:hypothetical protein [Jatrophihabitans sp.]